MNRAEAAAIDPDAVYTLRDAVALAHLSRELLRRAITDGSLAATRKEDGWHIAGIDLVAWIDAREEGRSIVPVGFLPASHVAALAGVAPSSVYRAIFSGRLLARRDGDHWLVSDTDATAWIATRRETGSRRNERG